MINRIEKRKQCHNIRLADLEMNIQEYQEELIEEQNAVHADLSIQTQHTESNLNYAEVIFEAGPSTSTSIVHGKEDRTIYSEIDLLCHADAIPSSSESDDDFMYVDGIENYNKQTCL
ncbi:uncharacterized protein LOC127717954 isoform X2 [Mytilus californianus]|uniref:uncharacterized protein LOC127717954 isoform X2 n=1 Tax=Mytilus californianus TaxID=6549 RepID=UPI0022472711|nr:uncharacterized protein LOC127717954 isoform X2 [Mytilus californianus]